MASRGRGRSGLLLSKEPDDLGGRQPLNELSRPGAPGKSNFNGEIIFLINNWLNESFI